MDEILFIPLTIYCALSASTNEYTVVAGFNAVTPALTSVPLLGTAEDMTVFLSLGFIN